MLRKYKKNYYFFGVPGGVAPVLNNYFTYSMGVFICNLLALLFLSEVSKGQQPIFGVISSKSERDVSKVFN